jgi:hypothetical protein
MSTCSSTATNQTFRYSNENLIAQDGTCLDIAGYSSGNGIKSDQIPIDLWQCGVAQQNQIWLAPKNP